ncbi:MAG: DUF1015 domain-containing protein [Actinomycetota bacterium]|nr:DUF1015 domain-containing protein [Actinomycetota bacterium]
MARVEPLHTVRYEPAAVGSLEAVLSPPYDVIDPPLRAELAARSPFNVVEIDLPQADGRDPYQHAEETFEHWRQQGILIREREPAVWALEQSFTTPDGEQRTRRGIFARVRVEDYGPGRIRPHERTHPGPKEDRLRLTRATRANLSPVFSLFSDPDGATQAIVEGLASGEPWARAKDDEGTENTLWRIADPSAIGALTDAMGTAELLIADGHHRYETARVYAEEVGGEGPHRYGLMLLCSLADPGLAILPTHRLLTGLKDHTVKQQAIREVLTDHFEVEQADDPTPPPSGPVSFGYMDSFHRQPYRVTLKDPAAVARALPDKPEAYRGLDTVVLEALVLQGALGMSEDDIAHLRGLGYSKSLQEAREQVESGAVDAAFFLRATPVEQVQAVAAEGESMPPKSTFFFPKVPTGLVFNLLEE